MDEREGNIPGHFQQDVSAELSPEVPPQQGQVCAEHRGAGSV